MSSRKPEKSGDLACSLVELRQIYGNNHVIEITMSVPATKQFRLRNACQQQSILKTILKESLKECEKHFITSYLYIFELNNQGNQHLHGIITIPLDEHENDVYVFMGDFYKTMYKIMTKIKQWKHIKYINQYWYPEYKRVKTPLLTLQYSSDDRCDTWYNYLTKTRF